ncbi:hypothetical protein GPECTOR_81g222 [Gonium pectorale]|uniref:Ribonuclease H1 N-terminal domain-containing protein n=1 Tax=Gonium pectorale TaxID=33097 RepID=A0A150G1M8_GONPE|nr:hypothetical protein GPECTOR_81g222 [Gonium pectorale]|eukprot:KXZ43772.1 hypothetical protein GPECTOR_81g222 [Gonium pectorale]
MHKGFPNERAALQWLEELMYRAQEQDAELEPLRQHVLAAAAEARTASSSSSPDAALAPPAPVRGALGAPSTSTSVSSSAASSSASPPPAPPAGPRPWQTAPLQLPVATVPSREYYTKWYAVRFLEGGQPAVYNNWQEAEAAIAGRYAEHQSFRSHAEALEYAFGPVVAAQLLAQQQQEAGVQAGEQGEAGGQQQAWLGDDEGPAGAALAAAAGEPSWNDQAAEPWRQDQQQQQLSWQEQQQGQQQHLWDPQQEQQQQGQQELSWEQQGHHGQQPGCGEIADSFAAEGQEPAQGWEEGEGPDAGPDPFYLPSPPSALPFPTSAIGRFAAAAASSAAALFGRPLPAAPVLDAPLPYGEPGHLRPGYPAAVPTAAAAATHVLPQPAQGGRAEASCSSPPPPATPAFFSALLLDPRDLSVERERLGLQTPLRLVVGPEGRDAVMGCVGPLLDPSAATALAEAAATPAEADSDRDADARAAEAAGLAAAAAGLAAEAARELPAEGLRSLLDAAELERARLVERLAASSAAVPSALTSFGPSGGASAAAAASKRRRGGHASGGASSGGEAAALLSRVYTETGAAVAAEPGSPAAGVGTVGGGGGAGAGLEVSDQAPSLPGRRALVLALLIQELRLLLGESPSAAGIEEPKRRRAARQQARRPAQQ